MKMGATAHLYNKINDQSETIAALTSDRASLIAELTACRVKMEAAEAAIGRFLAAVDNQEEAEARIGLADVRRMLRKKLEILNQS